MTTGLLINDIELGFPPVSAYHFSKLIKDQEVRDHVYDSHLYIIAQRNELTFHNFNFSKFLELSFEIRQDGNPEVIHCTLPILQKNIITRLSKTIKLRLHDRKNTIEKKIQYPFNGTQAFTVQEHDEKTNESKSLIWLSPDKLFYYYWKGHIEVEFSSNFSKMLNYKVHYVGKSTEQNICERLSTHSTFQEILINQQPFAYENIPSNEIMLLLLRINDNTSLVKWSDDITPPEISNYLMDYSFPNDKKVSSDAEKALIKHLQPEYNRVLYTSFPNKNDLVNTDFHNTIFYSIIDPIALVYKHGRVKGNKHLDKRDYITVER